MSHNKQLRSLLAEIETDARRANDEEALKPIFGKLRKFESEIGPLSFDNTAKWWIVGVAGLITAVLGLGYGFSESVRETLGDAAFIIFGFSIIALLGGLGWIALAQSAVDGVSELIFYRDVHFDNKLVAVNVRGQEKELYREYYERFGDFRSRGNEGHRITHLVQGDWDGSEYQFPYHYYRFRYVRVYYVPVTKKVGNTTITTMERRTQTLYRYGLILPFPYACGLVVKGASGSFPYTGDYRLASASLEDSFSVKADDPHQAAKLLKPAVCLALEELTRSFGGLNLEINRDRQLNISFSDSDVLELERKHSVSEPDAFEREIMSQLGLPKLRQLMHFIETLKRHNDSNFEQ